MAGFMGAAPFMETPELVLGLNISTCGGRLGSSGMVTLAAEKLNSETSSCGDATDEVSLFLGLLFDDPLPKSLKPAGT